jgi:uncharacterized membrane protein YphA (DoxX/SURF4 family)
MRTSTTPWIILIRLAVGSVFLSEGIQKFLYPAARGAGRFEKIGMPAPEILSYMVGTFEIICGALIVIGLLTRLAAIPTAVIMVVAIVSTKVPILLGHGIWGFQLRELSRYGFWSMAHETRTDFSMLLGSLFLIIVGAGSWSLDAVILRSRGGQDSAKYSG